MSNANPIAAIWSGAMMLEHLGYQPAADRIMLAIERTLADPATRTADLGGTANMAGVTAALLAHLA